MSTIILESATPGNRVYLARKKTIEEFLVKKGIKIKENCIERIVFVTDNTYNLFEEIFKNGFL